MKKLIIILYGGILLFACSNNHKNDQELAKIDTLLCDVHEDSAYNTLRRINVSKLSDDDKVYYNLLKTRAMYLQYLPISSDSTINKCISHYKESGDKEKLAWSYLYKGYLLRDSAQYENAILNFYNAKKYVSPKEAGELNIRIYAALSHVNIKTNNLNLAMQYAKKTLDLAKISDNKHFLGQALSCIGAIYSGLRKRDSAFIYIEKASPYIVYQPQAEQPYFLSNQALLFWRNGKPYKAEELLLKSIRIKPTPNAYSLLAELYGTMGKKDKVDSLWKLALHEKDLKTKINIMKPYCSWLKNEGRTIEAMTVMGMIPQMKDSLAKIQQAEKIKEIQMKIDRDIENEKSRNRTIGVITIILFVAVSALGLVTRYIINIKKQKQKALNEIETSQQMIENYEQEVDLLKTSEQKNKRKINELKREITKNSKEYDNMIYHGKMLYESIMNDGNILKWESEDFKSFFSYYRSVNLPFAKKLENDYTNLSKMYKLILCLMEMGFNNNKICKITNQSSNALSTMKSRINKKKIE